MEDNLITIARFTDNIKAEMAKQLLDDFGIKAILTGQRVTSWFGFLPTVAVELQVKESDAERALEVLKVDSRKRCTQCGQEFEDSAKYCPNCGAEIGDYRQEEVTAWTCTKCGEQVEAQFDTCWNCGTTKDGTPPPDPQEFEEDKQSDIPPSNTGMVGFLPVLRSLGP